MKTSISDTIKAEKFLSGELGAGESVVFEARLLVDTGLRSNLLWQRVLHRLVRIYSRKKIKQEMEAIHDRLFRDPSKLHFRESVLKHFKS